MNKEKFLLLLFFDMIIVKGENFQYIILYINLRILYKMLSKARIDEKDNNSNNTNKYCNTK